MDEAGTQKRVVGDKDALLRIDNETAEQIKLLSEIMGSSLKETTRWLTWLARKCMGRTVKIEDGQEILEISLQEFRKITQLETDGRSSN